MELWTPYILLGLAGIATMLWLGIRVGLKRLSDMSTQLAAQVNVPASITALEVRVTELSAQLAKLVNVPADITALINTVGNMERRMLDEHRRFDARITWLEAHAPPRVQPGVERP